MSNAGIKTSISNITNRLVLGLLCISSPLFFASSTWGQTATTVKSKPENQSVAAKNLEIEVKNIDALIKQGNIRELERILENQQASKESRILAIQALGKIGKEAEIALDTLKKLLTSLDKDIRTNSIEAISSIDATNAIDNLIKVLREDKEPEAHQLAAKALATVKDKAKKAIPDLLTIAKDKRITNVDARIAAIQALTVMELGKNKEASQILIEALDDKAFLVRRHAIAALLMMGSYGKPAYPKIIDLLADKNRSVRRVAADALGNFAEHIGSEAKTSVPKLVEVLKKDENFNVRASAAAALGKIDSDEKEKEVIPALLEALKVNYGDNYDLLKNAADSLSKIGVKIQEKAVIQGELSDGDLDITVKSFEEAIKILNKPPYKSLDNYQKAIKQQLDALKRIQTERKFIDNVLKNPSIMTPIIYLLILLVIFGLRPLWLLKIDEFLKPIDLKLPIPGAPEISPRWLIFFKYHPRVLDAWVNRHITSVREEFEEKNTVQDREVYIPIPVVLGGKTLPQLTGASLRAKFIKQRDCILIQGEGGVGKTSLACQIAKWAMADDENDRLTQHKMLPVLIEQELDLVTSEGKSALLATIQGQLQDLTNTSQPVSEEFLERLLRDRRILVIVDHFSEMSEATRKEIRPESPNFPINALIVTSRFEETLGHVTKTIIKPMRIAGNRLSSFMEAYLTQQGKRDLFTDSEFFNACSRLSQMVGQRNITALLAKLYAEQLMAAKVEEVRETNLNLPDNIPNLMLSYLNELNRSVTGDDKPSDRNIHQDAKAIAWECLQQYLRPAPIKRQAALIALGGENAETRLNYLEQRLHLIQTIGAGQDQIRFALDPLAEYLAALHIIEKFGTNENNWQMFIQKTKQISGGADSVQGFLLALQDCYLCQGTRTKFYEFVEQQLIQDLESRVVA
ncbi:MAG: NACHT domain-containing protein [Calothrix sp. CSU_2_0]|nr:NACHT domain-containing protein [Calothrix sp. CSU_2_0]